jgi:hypothetical protein
MPSMQVQKTQVQNVRQAQPHVSSMGTNINQGARQEASVIALKVKNLLMLKNALPTSNSPLSVIDNALLKAKSQGSKIYVDGDYRIMIFIPQITKESDNDLRAITVAKEIESIMNNHNLKSAQKLNFGLGVHTGQLAVETRDNKLKFVSLNNTISITKRIAEFSNSVVLLSDQLHKKTLGKVKSRKITGSNFWQVTRVPDRTSHEDFINRFLNRQRGK